MALTLEPSTCTGSASSGGQVSSDSPCGKLPCPEGQAAQQAPRSTLPGKSSTPSSVSAQDLHSMYLSASKPVLHSRPSRWLASSSAQRSWSLQQEAVPSPTHAVLVPVLVAHMGLTH